MILSEVLKSLSMCNCFHVSVKTKKERVFESMGTLTGIHIMTITHLNPEVFEKIEESVPEYMNLEVLKFSSFYDATAEGMNHCMIDVSDPFGDLSNTPASEILAMNKNF